MNTERICRVCAKVFPMEEQLHKFDTVSGIYFRLTALQQTEEHLPDEACKNCCDELLLFDNFRSMCLDAYEQLCQKKTTSVKTEFDPEEACESFFTEENPAGMLEFKLETFEGPIESGDDDDDFSEEDDDLSSPSGPEQKTNKDLKKIHCNQCDKYFFKEKPYQLHMLRHQGIQHFTCHICGTKKATKGELKMHVYSDHVKRTYGKEYPCGKCDAMFTSAGNRRRHVQLVHDGIKKYKCTYCDRAFGKPDTLKHHERTHTGEKPHECPLCGKRFIQLVAMKKHMRSKVHNN